MKRKKTFGDEINNFAHSIDIVNDEVLRHLISSIKTYLDLAFNIKFSIFHEMLLADSKVGLEVVNLLDYPKAEFSGPLKLDGGAYRSQVSMVYDLSKSAWIVGCDNKKLSSVDRYSDLWSNTRAELIPKYTKNTKHETYTSIIIPVERTLTQGSVNYLGVVNFESCERKKYSSVVADELKKLADSIALLYELNTLFSTQISNSLTRTHFFSQMAQAEGVEFQKKLKEPFVFVASPNEGREDVVGSIRTILNELDTNMGIKGKYWKNQRKSGDIFTNLAELIKNCHFGIFYLSTPSMDKHKHRYHDNDNVLIESGMLGIIYSMKPFENVILIREKSSLSLPFDLQGLRVIEIERDSDEKLNAEKFYDDLKSSIDKLLDNKGITN